MTSFFDKAKRQLLNKQLCVFFFLSFSTLFSATNAEDKDVSTLMSDDSQVYTSVNLPAEQDAVIYTSGGASVYDNGQTPNTRVITIKKSNKKLVKKFLRTQIKKVQPAIAPRIAPKFYFNSIDKTNFLSPGADFLQILFLKIYDYCKTLKANGLQNITAGFLYLFYLVFLRLFFRYFTDFVRESYRTRPPPFCMVI